jgi:hypothetical protein
MSFPVKKIRPGVVRVAAVEPVAPVALVEPVTVVDTITDANIDGNAKELVNRGTGAGGANTNKSGKSFEQKTENETRLLQSGFVKRTIVEKSKATGNYYLEKRESETSSVVYLSQTALPLYFKTFFSIEMFREPDEAYLFQNGDRYTLKILEKKNQNVSGSVDTKLMAGNTFILEYKECLGDAFDFDVQYAFCISDFLKKNHMRDSKKYVILRKILERQGITVIFGDDEDYYQHLDKWIFA